MEKQPTFERGRVNGIRLHVMPTKRFKTYAIAVYMGAPLQEDTVTPLALTPFVLRRGQKRTRRRSASARDWMNCMEPGSASIFISVAIIKLCSSEWMSLTMILCNLPNPCWRRLSNFGRMHHGTGDPRRRLSF